MPYIKLIIGLDLILYFLFTITSSLILPFLNGEIALLTRIISELFYLILLSSLLHESGHLIFAAVFNKEVKEIYIGALFSGVEFEDIEKDFKYLIICLAGPLFNLLLFICLMVWNIQKDTYTYLAEINLIIFLSNMIPIIRGSDGAQIIEILLIKYYSNSSYHFLNIIIHVCGFIILGIATYNEIFFYFFLIYFIWGIKEK